MTAEPVRTGMTFSKSAYSKTLLNRADTNQRMIIMISREEAINLLHILPVTVFEADYDKPFRDAIFMAIEALSQPERPKGRWVVENEDSIRCPECCYNRARIKYPLNFCPECGCDMRGEEE